MRILRSFGLGDERVGISQLEVTDLEILNPGEALKDVMDKARQYNGYDLVVLMITDLLREGTELLVEEEPTRIAQAFRDYGGVNVEPSAWAERGTDRFKLNRSEERGADKSAFHPEEQDTDTSLYRLDEFLNRSDERTVSSCPGHLAEKQVVPVLVKYLGFKGVN